MYAPLLENLEKKLTTSRGFLIFVFTGAQIYLYGDMVHNGGFTCIVLDSLLGHEWNCKILYIKLTLLLGICYFAIAALHIVVVCSPAATLIIHRLSTHKHN